MSALAYFSIVGLVMLFSLGIRAKLKSTYSKWGRVRNSAGITGAQGARTILNADGMPGVRLEAVSGQLTDRYDPRTKTIGLSADVHSVPSVAALAIAAHETGHALQDHLHYKPMALKTTLVPLAVQGARFGIPAALLGSIFGSELVVQVGVLAYVGALLLQFIALPVEFDASKRALHELGRLNLISAEETEPVRAVLRAAAMTYVGAAASSAAYLLYVAVSFGRWLFRMPAP